jgi:2-amino-4-hydroxy-6-hydroxymethyldihydropteridine diphosphokinase
MRGSHPDSNCNLVESFEHLALIALGSNLGDSKASLLSAMARLELLSATPVLLSSVWETDPIDCPPGAPRFVNAVAGITPLPDETPESLLNRLQALEREFGRVAKTTHNESRVLDLDLLTFKSETRDTPQLCLPHPRAHLRRFVLEPLAEILPELILPGQSKTVAFLLSCVGDQGHLRRLPQF